ncbi:ABC transporter ATP-binding protein [Qipengyuania qiaonensis]|uniref:ATP-binding cassette domain-containing protein n=1 Tax=Qipengyuania qiaonensis TaxID=2867240 RepID=A0ABS7J9D7_9SPHN|nr:ATP-binding cassette domain-containing protein [Qipengyuania qiaonensis]MBX7482278.1 ATP-binding cassette domain-containing protein [Qipengyuania qiaonensis]
MSVLQVSHLVKRFDNVVAVDDLSFTVAPGQIFGFLGGNGAGKTTTLRMVLDIIRPTSGTISVLGSAPDRRNAQAIGFLPEERGLYAGMSAIDTIVYFGRLKGMKAAEAHSRGMDLLARFDLAGRARSDIGDMSKGMAQKVQLATSLVNDPALLMLDEPFSGLDPVNQGLLEDEILRASRRGAAVIFSTHVMQHAERLCDRLLLLRNGRKRFEGTLDEARAALPARLIATAKTDLSQVLGVARAERGETRSDGWQDWTLHLSDGVDPAAVLEHCSSNAIALRRWDEHRASLHDVFVQLVGADPEHDPVAAEAAR